MPRRAYRQVLNEFNGKSAKYKPYAFNLNIYQEFLLVAVFPFGQPLSIVKQEDRTPKEIFVLGVYASAVHARWIGIDGKVKINALAV